MSFFDSPVVPPTETYPGDLAVVEDDLLGWKNAPPESIERTMLQEATDRIILEAGLLADLAVAPDATKDDYIEVEDSMLVSLKDGYKAGKRAVERMCA